MGDQIAKSLPPFIFGPLHITYIKATLALAEWDIYGHVFLCYGSESPTTLHQRSTSHCIQHSKNLYPYKTAVFVILKQKDLSDIRQMVS